MSRHPLLRTLRRAEADLEAKRISRDDFRQRLEQGYGIQTSVHYPAVHQFTQYLDPDVSLPVTESVVQQEVTLPLYYSMTEAEVDYVCRSVKEVLDQGVGKA